MMSNCTTCKKHILEPNVTYGINPNAVCKCDNPTPTKDTRLEDILEKILNELSNESFYEGLEIDNDEPYASDGWYPDTKQEVAQIKQAIESQYIKRSDLKELIESARPEKETFVKGDGDGSRQFNDYANGFNCGIKEYEYNLLNKIKEKR